MYVNKNVHMTIFVCNELFPRENKYSDTGLICYLSYMFSIYAFDYLLFFFSFNCTDFFRVAQIDLKTAHIV